MQLLQLKGTEGWHLKDFALGGYRLEKREFGEIQYSIDYRKLLEDDKDEYFEVFASSGWTHVCSKNDMHIFRAMPGTIPIYSDADSSIDKLSRLARPIYFVTLFFLVATIILWALMTITEGPIQQVSKWAFIFSFVFTMPSIMMVCSVQYQKWKQGAEV
ncbi:DUF2812 domain-containing protein [Psychrobacillus sp. NPDC096426]|uniref:DUF2812 domain-containing protein n=1 Tax=Psychrobacillus sp. NPDC096426 TaxID=3364491 RepID=UPI003821FB0E